MQTRNWKERKQFLAKLSLKNEKGIVIYYKLEKNEKNSQQLLKVNDNFFINFDFFFNMVKELPIPPIEYLQEQLHISTLLENEEIYFKQKELSGVWIPKIKKNWTEDDKQILIWIVLKIAARDNYSIKHLPNHVWEEVARLVCRRTVEQLKNKWNSLLKLSLQQTPWTKEQDSVLMDLIKKSKEDGLQNQWCMLANTLNQKFKEAPRTGKQCRERWNNHLNPEISRDPWSLEEDLELITITKKFKKKWAFISNNLNTKRSENAVKNRYNCLMKKYHCLTLIQLLEVLKNKFKQENPQLPIPKLKKRKLNPPNQNKVKEGSNASGESSKTVKMFQISSFEFLDQNSIKSLKPAFINFNLKQLMMTDNQHIQNYLGNQLVKIEHTAKPEDEQNLQPIESQISGMLNIPQSQNYVRYVPCVVPPQNQGTILPEKKSQFNIPGVQDAVNQQQRLPAAFIKPDSSFTFFSAQPQTNIIQKY